MPLKHERGMLGIVNIILKYKLIVSRVDQEMSRNMGWKKEEC